MEVTHFKAVSPALTYCGAWEVKPMKAIGSTYGGITGKTKADFGHGQARYIPFMNVMTDTVIDPEWLEAVDISPNEVQNLAKKGDLFFNGSSETPEEVGFCAVLMEEIPNLYLNSFCFGFRFNADAEVSGLFFAYWFRSNEGRKAMSVLAQGATRYNIAKSAFLKLEIPLPLEHEQRVIATAMSDVDALLAKLDALITKKRDLKVAAMQQLLTGQTRLPGYSGEWEVKRMKSLGNTYGGLTGKTKVDFGHGKARYIPFMNVMTDTVIDTEWLEAVDIGSNEVQNLTQKGDLFFNGSSETPEEVGFCSVLLQDVPNLYLNSFCFGFRFNADAKINGLFFAYWFRSVMGRQTMAVLAQGATRYNIAKSAFLKLELPQPSQAEQTAIATVLSDMDAELTALETRRDKTRALKQGMMQELLTGRIRLV